MIIYIFQVLLEAKESSSLWMTSICPNWTLMEVNRPSSYYVSTRTLGACTIAIRCFGRCPSPQKTYCSHQYFTFNQTIKDVTISAACAPPGGGRNPVTPRFLRHFAMFSLPPPSYVNLKTIFSVCQIFCRFFSLLKLLVVHRPSCLAF